MAVVVVTPKPNVACSERVLLLLPPFLLCSVFTPYLSLFPLTVSLCVCVCVRTLVLASYTCQQSPAADEPIICALFNRVAEPYLMLDCCVASVSEPRLVQL